MDLIALIDKAENRLSQVHPEVARMARQLITLAYSNGYEIIITQGYRTFEEQNELYAQGRTKAGQVVTNARGGESMHNFKCAVDIAVLFPDGDIDWDSDDKYTAIGHLAESIGFEWGGSWTGFKDLPHMQYTFGYSLRDLQNGVTLPNYDDSVLKNGCFNDNVASLQKKLIALGYQLESNGFFDGSTDWSVRDFQQKNSLASDGEVGSITMSVIDNVLKMEVTKHMSKYFSDLSETHWACQTIDQLADRGIVHGDQNGNFNPDNPITRAEVAVLVERAIEYMLQQIGK